MDRTRRYEPSKLFQCSVRCPVTFAREQRRAEQWSRDANTALDWHGAACRVRRRKEEQAIMGKSEKDGEKHGRFPSAAPIPGITLSNSSSDAERKEIRVPHGRKLHRSESAPDFRTAERAKDARNVAYRIERMKENCTARSKQVRRTRFAKWPALLKKALSVRHDNILLMKHIVLQYCPW